MKCKRAADGRTIDRHLLEVMCRQPIEAMFEGRSAASVVATFGVNVPWLYHWLADFATGGQNALLARPIPRRPPLPRQGASFSPARTSVGASLLRCRPQAWKISYKQLRISSFPLYGGTPIVALS